MAIFGWNLRKYVNQTTLNALRSSGLVSVNICYLVMLVYLKILTFESNERRRVIVIFSNSMKNLSMKINITAIKKSYFSWLTGKKAVFRSFFNLTTLKIIYASRKLNDFNAGIKRFSSWWLSACKCSQVLGVHDNWPRQTDSEPMTLIG